MFGIIADDLSGACDTAVKMRMDAHPVKVLLEDFNSLNGQEWAIAVSTDSRSMDKQQAYKAAYDAVTELQKRGINEIYKKIDSMFRGNIASEIRAALDASGRDIAVIAAAVPVYDRRIVNGVLVVGKEDNQSLDIRERHFGELNDHCELITMQVINSGVAIVREKILEAHSRGCKMVLMDSDSDRSLDIVAAAIADLPIKVLPVGASTLLEAIMRMSGEKSADKIDSLRTIFGRGRSFLFVIGSQHSVSRRQVKSLLENPDVACVKVNVEDCISGKGERQVEKCLRNAKKLLLNNPSVMVLAVDSIFEDKPLNLNKENGEISIEEIVDCVSRIAEGIIEMHGFDAMMVTGGETARMVFHALGVSNICLLGEYAPGIPIGIVHTKYGQELTAAIKSGGFGADNAMVEFIEVCNKALSNNVEELSV